MRASAISRIQTQPDPPRMLAQVKGPPFDSVRRRQTPGTALDFADTEEVTGFKSSTAHDIFRKPV